MSGHSCILVHNSIETSQFNLLNCKVEINEELTTDSNKEIDQQRFCVLLDMMLQINLEERYKIFIDQGNPFVMSYVKISSNRSERQLKGQFRLLLLKMRSEELTSSVKAVGRLEFWRVLSKDKTSALWEKGEESKDLYFFVNAE